MASATRSHGRRRSPRARRPPPGRRAAAARPARPTAASAVQAERARPAPRGCRRASARGVPADLAGVGDRQARVLIASSSSADRAPRTAARSAQQLVGACPRRPPGRPRRRDHVVGPVQHQRAGGADHGGPARRGPRPAGRRSGPRCARPPRWSARPAPASPGRRPAPGPAAAAAAGRRRTPGPARRPRLSSPSGSASTMSVGARRAQRRRDPLVGRPRRAGPAPSRSGPVNRRASLSATRIRSRTVGQRQVAPAARRRSVHVAVDVPAEPVGDRRRVLRAAAAAIAVNRPGRTTTPGPRVDQLAAAGRAASPGEPGRPAPGSSASSRDHPPGRDVAPGQLVGRLGQRRAAG